jgi:hypothetical protein
MSALVTPSWRQGAFPDARPSFRHASSSTPSACTHWACPWFDRCRRSLTERASSTHRVPRLWRSSFFTGSRRQSGIRSLPVNMPNSVMRRPRQAQQAGPQQRSSTVAGL